MTTRDEAWRTAIRIYLAGRFSDMTSDVSKLAIDRALEAIETSANLCTQPTDTSSAAGDAWQPIATAPKSVADGRQVTGTFLLGYEPNAEAIDQNSLVCVIWWEPLLKNSKGGRGLWMGEGGFEIHPTMWKPLSPAPGMESPPASLPDKSAVTDAPDHWRLREWAGMFSDQGFLDAADDMVAAADFIESVSPCANCGGSGWHTEHDKSGVPIGDSPCDTCNPGGDANRERARTASTASAVKEQAWREPTINDMHSDAVDSCFVDGPCPIDRELLDAMKSIGAKLPVAAAQKGDERK